MKNILLAMLFIASCTEAKKQLQVSPTQIRLGNVTAGDTIGYRLTLRNLSPQNSIHVSGIPSNCTCAIVESDSFVILPLSKREVRGKFIGKKEDMGEVSQRIAIHSDADTLFQFVTVSAMVVNNLLHTKLQQ